jgi:RNA polymerase sigma-70 factor, ECF subfamily
VTSKADSDDKRLVERMLSGDERAFDEFFGAYFGPLFRFAASRLGSNDAAAEDVVQSALSKAMRKLSTFRGEATLLTWLTTFCRHEISAYWRTESHQGQLPEDVDEIEAALDSLSLASADDPERRARRSETARLVHVTLDRLPRNYGEVLEWKYIDQHSVAEIAERLRVSAKAAESLLTRAREAFRDAFTILVSGGALITMQRGEQ